MPVVGVQIPAMAPGTVYQVSYTGTDTTHRALKVIAKHVATVGATQLRLEGAAGTLTIDQSLVTAVSLSPGPMTNPG